MPAAGRTCSQQRLQTPVRSNKDLHHWRGRTTIAIIHVEIEVTASPASEENLSAAGRLRRRFPLCTTLSAGPGQPSKALLPAAQRKKHHVGFFPCRCGSARAQYTLGERKRGPPGAGWGCSRVRNWDLGSLRAAPRSNHPEPERQKFSSSPACLKTIPARVSLAPILSTQLHLGGTCCAGISNPNLCSFLSPADLPRKTRRRGDCAGPPLLTRQSWDEEAVYLRKIIALAGPAALSATLAGLQDPLQGASGLREVPRARQNIAKFRTFVQIPNQCSCSNIIMKNISN